MGTNGKKVKLLKFCNKCKTEYADSYKRCPRCNSLLFSLGSDDSEHSIKYPRTSPPSPPSTELKVHKSLEKNISRSASCGIADEKVCQNNVTYIFRDNSYFYETKLSAMQSCDVCVDCMKMTMNERIQLFYHTSELLSITDGLSSFMSENEFCSIIRDVLFSILEIKNNGHISCEDLDISLSRIYLEGPDKRVRLICLPLIDEKKLLQDYKSVEELVRRELLNLLTATVTRDGKPGANLLQVRRLIDLLSNSKNTLEMVYRQAKGMH